MGFEENLNAILQHDHVEGVIFLDSEGEEIFSFGRLEHDHMKAMGAYQGIVLNTIQRLELGQSRSVITRCGNRCILTQNLKFGYFVCVLFSPEANLARAQFQLQDYFVAINNEL